MNYACIYVPHFMAQAVVRSEPTLRHGALAIIDGVAPLPRVVGMNERARRVGIEPGMTKVQAAQFPLVELRQRSPAQEATAHAALLDCASAFSPRLEATAIDTAVLDLTGLERLFHSPHEIACLAERVSALELEAQIALAPNPDAAMHAARGFPGITLIPPGREAERLSDLPVEVLGPPPEILETLARWGIRRFRDLAALPTLPLSERLGQEGIRLQQLARGSGLRPLVRAEAPLEFEETMEVEYPVALLDPLMFILGRLLDQLCLRLEARALATHELRLKLELEEPSVASCQLSVAKDGGQRTTDKGLRTTNELASAKYEKTFRLPVPMRDSKVFLKLLQLNLKVSPPPAPVFRVTIAAEPAKPRLAQGGFFLPLSPDPEKLEVTLARLAGVVGEGNVGAPELVETHRPGAFRMARFNSEGRSSGRVETPSFHRTTMAFRVFRPPLSATVEVRDGRPARLFAFGVRGEIISAAGPWRTSGDWWREGAWEQDEWDVEIQKSSVVSSQLSVVAQSFSSAVFKAADLGKQCLPLVCALRGALYRIYCDLASGKWFVQGRYD